MCRETPPGHVFVDSLAEIDRRKGGRSGASYAWQKNNASYATHFFALSPKPIARFRWKRARLSLIRPEPHLPSFSQIHPSFQDLLAKTTFQIVTIIGSTHSPPSSAPGPLGLAPNFTAWRCQCRQPLQIWKPLFRIKVSIFAVVDGNSP